MKKYTEEELKQVFENNSNCYADSDEGVMAMDKERFIETLKELKILPIHDVSVSLKSCINCKYYRKNKPHINTPLHECVVSNIERSLKTPSTFSCTQFHSR